MCLCIMENLWLYYRILELVLMTRWVFGVNNDHPHQDMAQF